jgi:hypothetical protein
MKRTRGQKELANSFFIRETEVGRLFGLNRSMAKEAFIKAQRLDLKEVEIFDTYLVRLSSVLRVLGISERELKEKVSNEDFNG